MRPPHCHRRPEIHIRLTLDVGKDGPVILGGEGRGINSFQTMLVCKQKLRAIVGNFLYPLAIILLPNLTPHYHGRPEIHIRLTLDVGQHGSVIWGQNSTRKYISNRAKEVSFKLELGNLREN